MTHVISHDVAAAAVPRAKCLVVDDLEDNLVALHALLEHQPVQVLQARSGAEALELLLLHEVALALIDVQMPGMDGFELAELMRGTERTRHVPIIFVTAGSHDRQRLFKGYDSGAVDFLFKPIEPHMLRSKVSVFCQMYRQKQQLAQTLQQREEDLRMHEMFTAVLGHDLRAPLSAILMGAELLVRKPDPAVEKVGQRVRESGRRMSRMIEDLLDVTRSRIGGGLKVARYVGDLCPLIERVVQERLAALPGRPVALHCEGDATGSWDADRLAQALTNLVANAQQHGAPGTTVEVVLDARDADHVAVRVSNTGTIPAALQPLLFDPFRSSRSVSGRGEGLGLGLYIVQQIVQAHGGTVGLRSVEGEPTVFTVTLPRA
jgi:two-component system sensor histidine kinase/response regulator